MIDNNVSTLKEQIRQLIKKRKSNLSLELKYHESELVFSMVESLSVFREANRIMLYYSLPDELPTDTIIKSWSNSKELLLPRIEGNNLRIFKYNSLAIEIGNYNIMEPLRDCEEVNASDIDLIIVPGIAFDHLCKRLGRGKGFYDKLLGTTSAIKIGVGFDCQIIESVPSEFHDCSMDLVITATNFFKKT